MRDNEAAMRRVSAEHSKAAGHIATAVEELRTYEAFSQAHVSGLKVLIDAFVVLYNSMSDTQKVNADSVFRKFGRRPHRAES